jgi:hypothetical protein
MFSKLLFIILAVGALAMALLVNRQQRIDTAHDISLLHQRLLDHERTLWKLQTEIAQRVQPSQVRAAIEALQAEWSSIPTRVVEPQPNAANEPQMTSHAATH